MNKTQSPTNTSQGYNYHANDNARNEHTLPTIHSYNTKNTPISNNAQQEPPDHISGPQSASTAPQHITNISNETNSNQLQTPMKLPHCTNL